MVPQVLVFGSIYQGKPFWVRIFDPHPCTPLQTWPFPHVGIPVGLVVGFPCSPQVKPLASPGERGSAGASAGRGLRELRLEGVHGLLQERPVPGLGAMSLCDRFSGSFRLFNFWDIHPSRRLSFTFQTLPPPFCGV